MERPGTRIRVLVAAALALTLGCSTSPRPVVFSDAEGGPDTADGLYRVQTTQISAAFLKPGADFSRYDSLVIDPVTVSYKAGLNGLSPESERQLRDIFHEALERQLGRSDVYEVVKEPGPRTLRVSGHLVDLVVRNPQPRGRDMSFVMDAGEMTLLLNVKDAPSGEPLARIAERRAVRPQSAAVGQTFQSTAVNDWGAVREITNRWARILRDGLDGLHTLPVPPRPSAAAAG